MRQFSSELVPVWSLVPFQPLIPVWSLVPSQSLIPVWSLDPFQSLIPVWSLVHENELTVSPSAQTTKLIGAPTFSTPFLVHRGHVHGVHIRGWEFQRLEVGWFLLRVASINSSSLRMSRKRSPDIARIRLFVFVMYSW
jgi:hypothetical protein